MIKKVKKLVVIVLLFMLILLPANITYARAGGGHGGGHGVSHSSSGGSGGSNFKIFDFLFLGGFTALIACGLVSLRKEERKYKEELDEIGESDPNWEFDNINFSMKDYIIESRGNKKVVVEGSKSIEDGEEYWKFVYRNNKWLLAEILQNEPQYNSEYFKKEVRRVEHKINNKKSKLK